MSWCCCFSPCFTKSPDDYEILKSEVVGYQNEYNQQLKEIKDLLNKSTTTIQLHENELNHKKELIYQLQKDLTYANQNIEYYKEEITLLNSKLYTIPEEHFEEERQEMILSCLLEEITFSQNTTVYNSFSEYTEQMI
jgi:septal ring factor EnvC (AmiA/AmiB activator)